MSRESSLGWQPLALPTVTKKCLTPCDQALPAIFGWWQTTQQQWGKTSWGKRGPLIIRHRKCITFVIRVTQILHISKSYQLGVVQYAANQ